MGVLLGAYPLPALKPLFPLFLGITLSAEQWNRLKEIIPHIDAAVKIF